MIQPKIHRSDSHPPISLAFALLLLLVAGSPVLAMSYGGLGPQFLTLLVAAMLWLLRSASGQDLARSAAVFRTISWAAAFPAVWMIGQLVPLPFDNLGQPIWQSAGAALSRAFATHGTIDLGFTLRALFNYATLVCLCFVTAVLSQNRERAETLLLALCAITAFGATVLVVFRDPSFIKPGGDYASPLLASSVFGTILSITFLVRTIERYETRVEERDLIRLAAALLGGLVGSGIGIAAMIRAGSLDLGIAMSFGLAVLLVVLLIRRLSLRPGNAVVVGSAVLLAGLGLILIRLSSNAGKAPLFQLTLADSANANAAARMASDATWLGSGVGTYQALASIYRDVDGLPGASALNSASSMLLGWGRLGSLLILLCLVVLFAFLLNGAIRRRRDSFYAAAAAACVMAGLAEAFCDASFTDSSVQMLAAIIIGLGLAQTVSHTTK
jgi:hypothetical protein